MKDLVGLGQAGLEFPDDPCAELTSSFRKKTMEQNAAIQRC